MADLKQIKRLSKVRRLARENPSEEEGAAARIKLVELMAKHGVTDRDMDLFEGTRPAVPTPQPAPSPWSGEFVVEIMPGSPFGRVFGFGFGFGVNVTGGTSGSTTSTDW